MGHYSLVFTTKRKNDIYNKIDELIDQGYADYCEVLKSFRVNKNSTSRIINYIRKNAPDEDAEEVLEEAIQEGKKYVVVDCHK